MGHPRIAWLVRSGAKGG